MQVGSGFPSDASPTVLRILEASHSDDDDSSHRRNNSSRNGSKSLYKEPPEARTPDQHWRLSVTKEDDDSPVYRVYRQSKYVFGRDKDQCDIRLHHSSCSNIHAVLQYLRSDSHGRHIHPYLMDLDSSHGTYLNQRRLTPNRYYKLEENDIIRFGESSREYVLLLNVDSSQRYARVRTALMQHMPVFV